MNNLNDRKNHPGDVPNHNSIPGVTGTNETNMREGTTIDQAAYRDGYVHGRNLEQDRLEANREVRDQVRDNDNAARGLLLGILLTGLVGLTVGATYFLSQRNQTPVQNSTIVIPKASPAPTQSPQAQSPQIIERDRIVPIPVPQQQAPAPNVNITVPSAGSQAPATQAPAAQSAPATQPASTQLVAPAAPAAPNATSGSSSTAPAAGSAPSSSPATGSGQ